MVCTEHSESHSTLVRSEELRLARQAKQRPGAICTWPQRNLGQSWELSPNLPAQGLSPMQQPHTASTEEISNRVFSSFALSFAYQFISFAGHNTCLLYPHHSADSRWQQASILSEGLAIKSQKKKLTLSLAESPLLQ